MSDWRCTSCGGVARYLELSLDPAHPFGLCVEQNRPCKGRVALTADPVELAAIRQHNKLGAARARHREHLGPRGRLVMTCTYCIALMQAQGQPARNRAAVS